MKKTAVSTAKAPKAIGPYSQGIIVDSAKQIIFLSGQVAIDPNSGKVALCSESISEQAEQVMQNIEGLLKSVGATFDNIVKTTIFLRDMKDFGTVNEIYAKAFRVGTMPARSTVAVSGLPLNALVEIECIVAL